MKEETLELTLERLLNMDKPALYALGLLASKALEKNRIVTFALDVLGRVQIMPSNSIEVKIKPKVEKELLDSLPEDKAIEILVAQGDNEDSIISYIHSREEIK